MGLPRSRWWLAGLRQRVTWLQDLSLTGVWGVLRRLQVHYKRGRRYLHSPDPAYDEKLALLAQIRALVASAPERFVLLYEDELSYYRRPSVGYSYARAGADAPRAAQGLHGNTYTRIAGSLDVHSGRFFSWQRKTFDRATLSRYFRALAAQYPQAELIVVALDNWPVHFHPDVLQALVGSRLVLLPLPTYAPWTNPTEKVWHKLYREVLHQHEFAERWPDLKAEVTRFLGQLASGGPDLLRYVGLYPG